MKKTSWVAIIAILVGVSLTALGCGQSDSNKPSGTTASAKKETREPTTQPLAGLPKEAIGQVITVDPAMKSLVIKPEGEEKKEMTFKVKETATGSLADFKPGDKVMVKFYVETDGKLTAESITKV